MQAKIDDPAIGFYLINGPDSSGFLQIPVPREYSFYPLLIPAAPVINEYAVNSRLVFSLPGRIYKLIKPAQHYSFSGFTLLRRIILLPRQTMVQT
jgi:hypothetical protein